MRQVRPKLTLTYPGQVSNRFASLRRPKGGGNQPPVRQIVPGGKRRRTGRLPEQATKKLAEWKGQNHGKLNPTWDEIIETADRRGKYSFVCENTVPHCGTVCPP